MLEYEPHHFQKIKLGAHLAQAFFIFISWAIEIAVFKSKDSKIDGRPGWYFGLCFLSIIPIIYLTMTPRYTRTRRFANPYAMATVDGLFCVFWLSAFAAQASYNSSGKCASGCKLSRAVVGLGVFIWLFWVFTTFMSLYAVVYYKREGYLPGASRAPTNAHIIDPDKDAFSTAPHGDEYVAVHGSDEHEIHDLHQTPPVHDDYDAAPAYAGGYVQPSVSDEYTGYTGASGVGRQSPVVGDNGRVHFPEGRY